MKRRYNSEKPKMVDEDKMNNTFENHESGAQSRIVADNLNLNSNVDGTKYLKVSNKLFVGRNADYTAKNENLPNYTSDRLNVQIQSKENINNFLPHNIIENRTHSDPQVLYSVKNTTLPPIKRFLHNHGNQNTNSDNLSIDGLSKPQNSYMRKYIEFTQRKTEFGENSESFFHHVSNRADNFHSFVNRRDQWRPMGVAEIHPNDNSQGKLPVNSKTNSRGTKQDKNFRNEDIQKGAQVEEIAIGQPCSECGNCKGYEAHTWRKNCKHCKCPRDCHAVSEFAARSRIGFSSSNDSSDARNIGYTFVPSGLTKAHQVAQFYSLLPNHEVPKIGTPGEVTRSQRLVKQLPKQDLLLAACEFVEQNHRGSYQDFVTARNEIALDIGYVKQSNGMTICENCNQSIPNAQYCVATMKMGDMVWHPGCFRCTKCDDLLVDLAYCVHKDKIYCERHYAECLKPRCEGCDELIFSGEYTKAMNKDWHGQHFCCWQCDESLTGQRYVLRDDHPYCVSCYESVFANACEKCSRTIGIDSKDLSYKDKHWHEACFLCTTCGESLVDKQFGSKGERIYCGRCYDNQFASRCDGCNEIFRAGTKKMEYKTRQWHEKCFCCCVCKVPIGTQSFIPREQEIYCAKCYEEKFATRCIKCNKVITSGGVTYKNEPWHRECFTCTHCSKSLAGERFTSRDDKPYCAECFGELFAKRCFACNKPITGIGGTKFISFEDRHWHNDCFFCASCRTSLVGRGFITDQEDIICPDCAKQKLL